MTKDSLAEVMSRLESRLKPNDNGCLNYTGSLSSAGYGQISFQNYNRNTHRIAYLYAHGEIPDGKMVLHKCNNKACCNPDHLYAGTRSQNSRDAIRDGVARASLCVEQIRVAVRLRQLGWPLREIAELWGVSITTVSRACRRDTYDCLEFESWTGYDRRTWPNKSNR